MFNSQSKKGEVEVNDLDLNGAFSQQAITQTTYY